MAERTFPILHGWGSLPKQVPWSFVEPGRAQAERNHYQTLERLAERGGLSPSELVAVLVGVEWERITKDKDVIERWLLQRLHRHERGLT
jgi:hypothetical protein